MSPIAHTLVPILAVLAAAPFASSRALNTFKPRQATPGFQCEWPVGWKSCNTPEDRACWVIDPQGKRYDVNTDYEDFFPEGSVRTYDLTIDEAEISPDGFKKKSQVINGKYPGELIEACWGDTVIVNVKNNLKNNGTTIHWHGLRMFQENHMDGVNGVTQCPISEGDTFTYKFRLRQYGHTWYHSHYSSQYTDGVAAPFLIHGPTTENWTKEWNPIIVTDWYHQNAYEAFHKSLTGTPAADAFLVNGTGRSKSGGSYYEQTFEHNEKYLIRLVNGGTDFHFQFSIDNHKLLVVAADLVPVEPFEVESISVGIGQRYSVIVHANQTASSNGKYWMRTEYKASGCQLPHSNFPENNRDNQRVGIISYSDATEGLPATTRYAAEPGCSDPVFKPRVNWTVTEPQNDILKNAYYAGRDNAAGQIHSALRWELAETPMWLNFSDPTIMHLDNSTWNPEYAVAPYNFGEAERFVYMIINSGRPSGNMIGGAHPIHLHGHDFAILSNGPGFFDPAKAPTLNLENPPRRDVAMLPDKGHLVIAFKTDNPGAWLVHCHIGWHAGSGLALQVLERQEKIKDTIGVAALDNVNTGCKKWTNWIDEKKVWKYEEQEDSGI